MLVVIAIFVGFEFCDTTVTFATEIAVEVAAQLARALGLNDELGCGSERLRRGHTCALGSTVDRCGCVSSWTIDCRGLDVLDPC